MSDGESSAKYQGVTVQAGFMDRRPGLTGDIGFLDFNLADLKAIKVTQPFRLWLDGRFTETPGPLTIQAAKKLRQQAQPTTPTTSTPSRKDGLDRGGGLTLTTKVDNGTNTDNNVTEMRGIYLLPSGIEELESDNDNAFSHSEGIVRVPVTDIRHFWAENGTPVYGDLNVLLENGQFDETTTKDGQTPWSLKEFLDFLCLGLPGSPNISGKVLDDSTRGVPINIKMRLELPSYWLSEPIDAFGLELHLTFGAAVYFAERAKKHTPRSFARDAGGNASALGVNPAVEKKTVFVLDRPESVMVVGSLRQQRIRRQFIPVFIDEDQKVKRMADLKSHWGYSFDQALGQAMIREDKAYEDIPGKDLAQRFARQKIAKAHFFKLYAPLSLFNTDQGGGTRPGAPVATAGGVGVYWDFSKKKCPFLPALDPWWTPDELKDLNVIAKTGTQTEEKANPSNAALIQTNVIVKGNLVRQRATNNIQDALQTVFAFIDSQKAVIARLNAVRSVVKKLLDSSVIKENDPMIQISGPVPPEVDALVGIKYDEFLRSLQGSDGDLIKQRYEAVEQMMSDESKYSENMKPIYQAELTAIDQRIVEVERAIGPAEALARSVVSAAAEYGYFRGWVNIPWGIIDPGEYTFDSKTGLLHFREIAAVMESAAVFDRESGVLAGDGNVEVTYNCEYDSGSPTDMTYVVVVADKDGKGTGHISQMSGITYTKGLVVRDDDLILYSNESGKAMNADIVKDQAARIACSLLKGDPQQDGYYYEYEGLWHVATSEEVNQVTWEFDGDRGRTKITANFPDKVNESGAAAVRLKKLREKIVYRNPYVGSVSS